LQLSAESEELASSTLAELRKQREQIKNTQRKAEEIDHNLNQSDGIISKLESNCSIL
jgi:Snare region anchored in the vesicle membrane C-terminus